MVIPIHPIRRVLRASVLMGLAGILSAASHAQASVYQIPEDSDYETVETTVEDDIPEELNKATCGFRKDMEEGEGMTTVSGVPLAPGDWRGQTNDEEYPDETYGKVFASYMDNPHCEEFRNVDPPQYHDTECRNPDDCLSVCEAVNEEMRYPVDRLTHCTFWTAIYYWVCDDTGYCWEEYYCDMTDFDTDQRPDLSFDCNSCPDSSPECPEHVEVWEYFGEKYECTGDWDEQQEGRLKVGYGWVWDGDEPAMEDAQDWCHEYWKDEEKEYPNCEDCGPPNEDQPDGKFCRTAAEIPTPDSDPPFDPLNGSRYESFYRRYVATHVLGNIPDTEHDEEYEVQLACYKWYKEQGMDPRNNSDDLNCIADDLQLKRLKEKRKVNGSPTFNKEDNLPELENRGGFALDIEKKKKSGFAGPELPEPEDRPPFGETEKYVSQMLELERYMEGFPPTVELVMPLVSATDELEALFTETRPAGQSPSVPLIELSTPMKPGLVEAVREMFRTSLLSRLEEDPIPVVIPLVSDAELQTLIEAWEAWKKQRELLGKDGSAADDVTQKLQEYRAYLAKLRTLRTELPRHLAKVLERRKELSDAIDEWIESRMQPYREAMDRRERERALLEAWKALKNAYGGVETTNSLHCKNDVSTPPLEWIEQDDAFDFSQLPDLTPYPKHFIFDFSDIFFTGLEQAASLRIPVLRPVQVSLRLPSPPSSYLEAKNTELPDLPGIPSLPEPELPPLAVEKRYGNAPAAEGGVPIDALTAAFAERTGALENLRDRYEKLLWVKEPHKDLNCPTFGEDGCVFPEPKLWHAFMRIWAPLGAFLDPGEPPTGVASPPPPLPECDEDDDLCRLEMEVIKEGLRVTLPPGDSASAPFENARNTLREKTIDKEGKLVPSANPTPYDVASPGDLYESFSLPENIPLDFPSSPPTPAPQQ
ncbi:MAG: hypothetical protein PHW10_04725 [Candidatus Peribacteraceae bacterium]|nr:hypothetical protein [Candidatus Peribacteraceae bacterium]